MVDLIRRINKQKFVKIDLFDLYLFASFISSAFLWAGLFLNHEDFFSTGLASSALLVGNYFYFINGLGYTHVLKETSYFSGLFIFQIICLIGMSFAQGFMGGVFLSLVPCMAGTFFFIRREAYSDARIKGVGLFIMGICSFLAFNEILGSELTFGNEFIALGAFAVWAIIITAWAGKFVLKEQRSFLFSILKKRKSSPFGSQDLELEKREKFFYHDLINQTHGLNLFLKHRINSNKGLNLDECEALVGEVRTIQSLIKDHFGMGHKNLVNTYEYVDFEFAKPSLINLVETFLPPHEAKCHFIYRGLLETPSNGNQPNFIHYPSVYRILNNLVKNMSENKSLEAEFIFDYQDKGLVIETKNKIFKLKDDHDGKLAQSLSEIILDESKNELLKDGENGYGLDSITSLCEELGGNFFFAIEGEYWVNRIFLPPPKSPSTEDMDNFEDKIKRAA